VHGGTGNDVLSALCSRGLSPPLLITLNVLVADTKVSVAKWGMLKGSMLKIIAGAGAIRLGDHCSGRRRRGTE
jgi:hypothetical protein